MQLTRRGLIAGLASLVAAPAIVRASSLMPVKAWVADPMLLDEVHLMPGAVNWVSEFELMRCRLGATFPGKLYSYDLNCQAFRLVAD
jgi:hypothetical protein